MIIEGRGMLGIEQSISLGVIPTPIPAQRTEMSIARASCTLPASEISAAISKKETDEQFTKYASLRLLPPHTHLEAKNALLRSSMFMKRKSSGLVTALNVQRGVGGGIHRIP